MTVNTPWRDQRLPAKTESKQTPRPRPPAFVSCPRRPSSQWKAATSMPPPPPPPPYRRDLDPSVVIAARELGLDVALGGDEIGMEVEGEADASSDLGEGSEEMKKRLKDMEKRLCEREKELSLAAQIGQSLLTTNISLRTQHDSLLSSLPSAISKTVDRLSAPPSVARKQQHSPSPFRSSSPSREKDADLPEDLKITLAKLRTRADYYEQEDDLEADEDVEDESPTKRYTRNHDTIRDIAPRRPPLRSFTSSSSASSHSYARAQLQDLAEQNEMLLAKLREVEEEEEVRRKKMRKLESEIARLRSDLEKAEERREEESAVKGRFGSVSAKVRKASPRPERYLWRPRTHGSARESSISASPEATSVPFPQFPGTPQPLPILRRSRRQDTAQDDSLASTPGPRLSSEKTKADFTDATLLLRRAAHLRTSPGHKSTQSTGSIPSSPSGSLMRGQGNRGMIETRRSVRKKVSLSSLLEPRLSTPSPARREVETMGVSRTSSLRAVSLRTPLTFPSPASSARSPCSSLRATVTGSAEAANANERSLGSELGDDWAQESLDNDDDVVTSEESLATGLALSALLLALAPSTSMLSDSSTPILPPGAFKGEDSMDSSTFDLLDQAVCERSMRWADDEKNAEDEMETLNACDANAIEASPDRASGSSWALTRFKTMGSEKRLVKRWPVRDLPPPSKLKPHRPSAGFLSWGEPADPWDSTMYPEDAGMPSPPRPAREQKRIAPARRSVQVEPLPSSLSTRVKHSRSQSRARQVSMRLGSPPPLIKPLAQPRSPMTLRNRVVRKAIEVLTDLWIFIQCVVVIGVFLCVTLRKGPRAILGASSTEKSVN